MPDRLAIEKIEQFDPTDLTEGEWMALADHADGEVYVWTKMSEWKDHTPEQQKRYAEYADHWRENARLYREFAAIESQVQEEYEREEREEGNS